MPQELKSLLEDAAGSDDRDLSGWARPILERAARDQLSGAGHRRDPSPEEIAGKWWISLPADVRMHVYRVAEGLRSRKIPLDRIPLPEPLGTAPRTAQAEGRPGRGRARSSAEGRTRDSGKG